ncbi:MAG: Unknown protein [uncultured Sulfurovum sp.]|uniref:Uncharacterized protein n=1 Tax=uncultured Sulfurovum sp. TaxID=269237 RepID=A0A6S6RYL8_9BACT|nr:MAG: Unknown protein [uncultured Sulfurovum sp.]
MSNCNIQQLYRFNEVRHLIGSTTNIFKYNNCIGSILEGGGVIGYIILDLNTTTV